MPSLEEGQERKRRQEEFVVAGVHCRIHHLQAESLVLHKQLFELVEIHHACDCEASRSLSLGSLNDIK